MSSTAASDGRLHLIYAIGFLDLAWYYKWYHFSVRRDTTCGAPLKSSPGRLQWSLLFHREEQTAPEAQISLLPVELR